MDLPKAAALVVHNNRSSTMEAESCPFSCLFPKGKMNSTSLKYNLDERCWFWVLGGGLCGFCLLGLFCGWFGWLVRAYFRLQLLSDSLYVN